MHPDDALAATRRSLHAVAEQLLAGPQYRRTGSIRLSVTDGGFATDELPGDPSRLTVRAGSLVADRRGGPFAVPLSGTIASIAAEITIDAGPPIGVYDDGSGTDPSFHVAVDDAAAHEVLRGFSWGDEALRAFLERYADQATEPPVLWPEHFDVAITVAEINYGVSPGDRFIAEPYAYVGPWQRRAGAFWNLPFGAARSVRELGSAQAVLGLFEEGRRAAAADPFA